MANLTYISSAAEKRPSRTHGRGLFAKRRILKGEVVAVKGGYVMTRQEWAAIEPSIGPAEVHISEDLVIAPSCKDEYESSMMHLNHSCEPNVGIEGQIAFVTMRDVDPDEELTLDYAMMDDFDGEMICNCGSYNCRNKVTGQDWRRQDLQRKYQGYFSAYLQRRFSGN
jgi:uncharacterized protein